MVREWRRCERWRVQKCHRGGMWCAARSRHGAYLLSLLLMVRTDDHHGPAHCTQARLDVIQTRPGYRSTAKFAVAVAGGPRPWFLPPLRIQSMHAGGEQRTRLCCCCCWWTVSFVRWGHPGLRERRSMSCACASWRTVVSFVRAETQRETRGPSERS